MAPADQLEGVRRNYPPHSKMEIPSLTEPLPDHNPWLAKLARGAFYALLCFIFAVASSLAVSLLLQGLLFFSPPYGDIRPFLYWSQFAAIVVLAPLTICAGFSYARGSSPSLRRLLVVVCLAALLVGFGTAYAVGPFIGALSIPLLPAWVAGGVAASIVLARSMETSQPMRYAKSALLAGVVAGAVPVAVSILLSFIV